MKLQTYGLIDALLIDALSIEKAPQPQPVISALDTKEWLGWYVLSPNRFQMFEYLDTVFGAIRVSPDNAALVINGLQQKPRKLRPVGDYLYSVNDRATTSHVFLRSEDGEYLLSDGFRTYQKVPAAYLAAHWASALAGLLGVILIFVSGAVSLVRYRCRVCAGVRRPRLFGRVVDPAVDAAFPASVIYGAG